MYEIWRQRNPESRMYMDAKKLMNQKNYIMKHNKITEMQIEEIKKELQANQRSQLEEREEEEELEHPGTIRDREQQANTAFTTDEETKIHQQRDQAYKLKEKIESTYYQVTQIAIDNRPRLQKLQNMLKIKVIMKTADEAMEEILVLDEKDLNIAELNHLNYAAPTFIREEKKM